MSLIIAFVPFIAFALLSNWVSSLAGLLAAAALAAALLLRDALTPGRHVKLLEVGSVLMFGSLAALQAVTGSEAGILAVRLRVDAGLFALVLLSLVIRRPFTLAYAKEQVQPEVWTHPRFLHTNDVLTAAWAAAFAVVTAADAMMLGLPEVPRIASIAVTALALLAGLRFTTWYPDHAAARAPAGR